MAGIVVSIPDPRYLNEEQIAELELNQAGWQNVWLLEQQGKNRVHVVEYCRVKSINPDAVVSIEVVEEEAKTKPKRGGGRKSTPHADGDGEENAQ